MAIKSELPIEDMVWHTVPSSLRPRTFCKKKGSGTYIIKDAAGRIAFVTLNEMGKFDLSDAKFLEQPMMYAVL